MMKPTDNPADPFKKALAEATRVMADDADLTVTYSVDPPGMTKDGVRLPQVSRRMTRDEVLLARGTADAFALRHKYHDAATAARYAPTGQLARDIYDAMETARCEAVGARAMPGTAGNIDAKIGHEADRKGYAQITRAEDAPLATAAGYLVRHLATGRDLPRGASNVMDLWRGFIEDQAGGTLENLDHVLADQAAFARLARKVISDLGYGDQLGDDPDQDDQDEAGDDA
jgi:cobaltochelatase CobT